MRQYLGWPPAMITGDTTPFFDEEVAGFNTNMHLIRYEKCCHNAPKRCRTWCHHTVLSGYTRNKTKHDQVLDQATPHLLHQPRLLGQRHTELRRRETSSKKDE